MRHILFYSKGYIRYSNTDCLFGVHYHTIHLGQVEYYETCRRWCNNDNNCRAFVVYENTCYFKDGDCENDLYLKYGATTLVPQSKANEIRA